MSAPEPYWSDGQITLHLGDCLDVLASMDTASVDAIVTDPPYGLEFMGREWDGADGFRRSLNEADAGRDNVFGRTSRTSPEYRTGSETWRAGAGMSKPGIGERPTEWPSFGGRDSANATCATCGGRMRGARKCACPEPEWRVKGQPLDRREGQSQMHLYQSWCEAWAAECLRVLKPGGHLLAFGGTRTWHRLTCAIEDAGFEIRDSLSNFTGMDAPALAWIYGQGFPKSLNVSKAVDGHVSTGRSDSLALADVNAERPGDAVVRPHSQNGWRDGLVGGGATAGPREKRSTPATAEGAAWDGWGTALKPAWEPIVMARKPLTGTVASNVLEHGTGALNVAGCMVPHASDADRHESEGKNRHADFASGPREHQGVYVGQPAADRAQYDGGAGRWPPNLVLGEVAAGELDRQSGITVSRAGVPRTSAAPGQGWGMTHTGAEHADTGGASRFFPIFRYTPKAGTAERPRLDDGTSHPTVKPVSLIRWLVRMVTPPGGLVLDPFAGSGTTAEACVVEGFRCLLIEKDPKSVDLIRQRLRKDIQPDIFGGVA